MTLCQKGLLGREKQQNAQAVSLPGTLRAVKRWSKAHPGFRAAYALAALGVLLVSWLTSRHPDPALAALVCLTVAVVVLTGPVGRAIGLPTYRPNEAYRDTLHRWRRERGER